MYNINKYLKVKNNKGFKWINKRSNVKVNWKKVVEKNKEESRNKWIIKFKISRIIKFKNEFI